MPEFTPGPWVAIETKHRTLICAAQGDHVTACEKPTPADARLIAAAPELLTIARALVDIAGPAHELDSGGYYDMAELVRMAHAAITKATRA